MLSTEEGGSAVGAPGGAVSTDQTITTNTNPLDTINAIQCTDFTLSNGELKNLRSLDEAFDGNQLDPKAKPLIRRVPSIIGRHKDFRKYFKPKVISIGPLHHNDPTFHGSEMLELRLAAHFVENIGVNKQILYNNMKTEIDGLKKCYDPKELEKYSNDDQKLAIKRFIDDTVITPADMKEPQSHQQDSNQTGTKRHHSHTFHKVKELKKAGIWLKASKTSCLTDTNFNSTFFVGNLWLLLIIVDDSTGPKFMNLIAYDMCPDFDNDFTVTSYMCFLDSLIDEAEDVKALRHAGIL
ncbi:hypothetical protein J1N35_024026 [Gossypium stocksii]|uniref:Uncharacterized protein n=1 Tax=Gossypium stocksii TaxID=47602 RepID=A0A9D4A4I1_9ROSI|nr:hypothetical protein J1N35_024026 [Gossypium stocksii]